jgi:hypothetical protein
MVQGSRLESTAFGSAFRVELLSFVLRVYGSAWVTGFRV